MSKKIKETISNSEQDTKNVAYECAQEVGPGDVLCLYGDLGAGKSVFARSLIRALSQDDTLEVPSPTFTLVEHYDTGEGYVHHFDLYRLKDPEDVYEIGFEDVIYNDLVLVEWPERLGDLLPLKRVDIRIEGIENKSHGRKIRIERVG